MRYFKIVGDNFGDIDYSRYGPGDTIEDPLPFDNTDRQCGPGGIYTTSLDHIANFLEYGYRLREVVIPPNTPSKHFQNKSRYKRIRVLRDNIVIYEGELESLRRYKDDVSEVRNGMECGIAVKSYNDVKAGDKIEVYKTIEIQRTL